MTECAGLEIRYTLSGYRGFESLTLRKKKRVPKAFRSWGFFYLYKYLLILFLGVFSNSFSWISIAASLQ